MIPQKKVYLLPHRYQTIGWIVACVALLTMAVSCFLESGSAINTRFLLFGLLLLYIGLFFVGFSREKTEDEFTLHLRTSSALIALLIICAIRIILKLIISILISVGVIDNDLHEIIRDPVNEITGFASVFILYLILFKIRLSRYNNEEDNEE